MEHSSDLPLGWLELHPLFNDDGGVDGGKHAGLFVLEA